MRIAVVTAVLMAVAWGSALRVTALKERATELQAKLTTTHAEMQHLTHDAIDEGDVASRVALIQQATASEEAAAGNVNHVQEAVGLSGSTALPAGKWRVVHIWRVNTNARQ